MAIKKNEILPVVTAWIDLEGITLSKKKLVKERQIPYNFTYMWNLNNKINEQTKLKQTHRYREWTGGWQRGGGCRDWKRRRRD